MIVLKNNNGNLQHRRIYCTLLDALSLLTRAPPLSVCLTWSCLEMCGRVTDTRGDLLLLHTSTSNLVMIALLGQSKCLDI